LWDLGTDELGDGLSELQVDVGETLGHAVVDDWVVTVVKLEGESGGDVSLLWSGHGVVEELSLVEVLSELLALKTHLHASNLLWVVDVTAILRLDWRNSRETVWPVVDSTLGNGVTQLTVTLVVHDWAYWTVDWEFLPVGAKTGQLGVEVGEVTALEKRVIGETNTWNDVAGAEGDLLGLGEVLVDVAVELKLTNVAERNLLDWPDLGGIENVKLELVLIGLWNQLNVHVPLWESAGVDGSVEILAVEIGVLASKLQSLVPNETVNTEVRSVVELDEVALALGVLQSVGVDTETLHHTVRSWNTTVRLGPHEHVSGLRVEVLEVPEVVVSGLSLRNLIVWLWLSCVDDIWELDGVLNEENWDVVSNHVPVTLVGVHLEGETAYITDGISATTATENSGESEEQWCLARGIGQDTSRCDVLKRLLQGKGTKGGSTTGVYNSFWNALMVEAVDLLSAVSVFEEGWTTPCQSRRVCCSSVKITYPSLSSVETVNQLSVLETGQPKSVVNLDLSSATLVSFAMSAALASWPWTVSLTFSIPFAIVDDMLEDTRTKKCLFEVE